MLRRAEVKRAAEPDPAAFREAMSRLAGAVHVVTTDGPAGRAGFTATAVVAVSDRPATMLACLNRANSAAEAFRRNGMMAINTLAAADQAVAEVFSGRTGAHGLTKFDAAGAWTIGAFGQPVLAGALVVVECRLVSVTDVATHQVMMGEVVSIDIGAAAPALIYQGRTYRSL